MGYCANVMWSLLYLLMKILNITLTFYFLEISDNCFFLFVCFFFFNFEFSWYLFIYCCLIARVDWYSVFISAVSWYLHFSYQMYFRIFLALYFLIHRFGCSIFQIFLFTMLSYGFVFVMISLFNCNFYLFWIVKIFSFFD